eukprot:6597375-Pyramimonas_sp.AAC.1
MGQTCKCEAWKDLSMEPPQIVELRSRRRARPSSPPEPETTRRQCICMGSVGTSMYSHPSGDTLERLIGASV